MEQHVNSYQGLSQDGAFDTIGATLYIDAQDVRITTAEGESQGAITNIQGNEEAFIIPQTDSTTQDKEIIGVCVIRTRIILFCADSSGNKGWIYFVEYDEKSRTILNPGTPIPEAELVYDANGSPEDLNFNKDFPIEAVGRYESDCVQRIYWTDYNDQLKSLKIESFAALPVTTSVNTIGIFPNVEWTQPIITNIGSGGILNTGMYQFAYRLITIDGKQTLISPPGVLTHIVSASDTISDNTIYMGDLTNTNTGKTITVSVDTSNYINEYKEIEFIVVYYPTVNVDPEIYSIEKEPIVGNTTSIIYSGNENTITTITAIEYAIKVYPFSTVKTLVPKDNSLIIANLKSTSFDVKDLLEPGESLDLQTIRYNSNADKPSDADPSYNETDDKFNLPYNRDAHWDGNWHENEQFKYQIDGETLGGQTDTLTNPNIKYKFTIKTSVIDYVCDEIRNREPRVNTINQQTSVDLDDGYSHPNNSYSGASSPYTTHLTRGYKRGETYRFGIVFYNKKGESSFVSYIGDIKFPDISERTNERTITQGGDYTFPDTANPGDNNNWINNSNTDPMTPTSGPDTINYFPVAIDDSDEKSVGCNLGLEITLDFTTCPSLINKITSYQIVRVERQDSDKRRWASGQIRTFHKPFNYGDGVIGDGYNFGNISGLGNSSLDGNNHYALAHQFLFGNGEGEATDNIATYDANLTNPPAGKVHNGAWNFLNATMMGPRVYTDNNSGSLPDSGGTQRCPGYPMGDKHDGDLIAFYSPEISYKYKVPEPSMSIGYLITGAYDRFEGFSPNEGAPNCKFRQIPDDNGVWHDPGDDEGGNPQQVGYIREFYRKIRNTRPIELTEKARYNGDPGDFLPGLPNKPISHRGIEYYRNAFNGNFELLEQLPCNTFNMNSSCFPDDVDGNTENAMKSIGPFIREDEFTTGGIGDQTAYAKNMRIACWRGASDKVTPVLWNRPNDNKHSKISRGGTSLFTTLGRADVDPVTGGGLPTKALLRPFDVQEAFWNYSGAGVAFGLPLANQPVRRCFGTVVPAVNYFSSAGTGGDPFDATVSANNSFTKPSGILLNGSCGTNYDDEIIMSVFDNNYSVLTYTPVVDIVQHKAEIYGGYTDGALEKNTFFPCSPVIGLTSITPSAFKVFSGDIFIAMFACQEGTTLLNLKFFKDNSTDYSWQWNHGSFVTNFPVETQVNLNLDYGSSKKTRAACTGVFNGNAITQEYLLQEDCNDSSWAAFTGLKNYMYAQNPVYSLDPISGLGFFVKPEGITDCGKNDIRAYLSDVKINEEELDSWVIFRSNNYYDIDSEHGPINKIVNWNDEVYFFQDTGVGRYSINPRAITTTEDGEPTELGSAQGFADHKYITTEQGSIHQWGVKTTDTGIYYFDATSKKIFRIGGQEDINQPLSESKGMHSFFSRLNGSLFLRKENEGDNPIQGKGINIGRDSLNDEVLFSLHGLYNIRAFSLFGSPTFYEGEYAYLIPEVGQPIAAFYLIDNTFEASPGNVLQDVIDNSSPITVNTNEQLYNELIVNKKTLVFDELADTFSSFYSAVPGIYLETNNILMSPKPGEEETVFTHNKGKYGEFYGTITESFVQVVINPNADINKVLRYLEFNSTVRDKAKNIDRDLTITHFRVQTEYQDTTKVAYSAGNVKRRFDKWRIKIPRDQLSTSRRGRLRSTFFILTLYYDNTYNKELILNRLMSHYDIQIF